MKTPKSTKSYSIPLLLQRRRKARGRNTRSFLSAGRNMLVALGLLLSTLIMGAVILFALFFSTVTSDLPAVEAVPAMLDPETGAFFEPARFYDRSGQQVIYTLEIPGIDRRLLKVDPEDPDRFSPHLTQVVIALVEPGFWSSPGFSWRHLTRLEPVTIAENLVDHLLLQEQAPGQRKALQMRLLAAQLTARYGRAQVLGWYLNSASFGHMTYGANQAASLYLEKPASRLNLAEAALLGSLLSTPSLNPLDAPLAAVERTAETLDQLESAGLFAQEDIEEARAVDLTFAGNRDSLVEPDAFIQYALKQAEGLLGRQQIEHGGLRVITTLDARLQDQLLCTLEVQINRLEDPDSSGISVPENCQAAYLLPTRSHDSAAFSTLNLSGGLLANALILDPRSAEILAWTGQHSQMGPDTSPLQYQAGSLLTPFVAAAAFARGFSPASLVWDVPLKDDDTEKMGFVLNRDGVYHGPVHLRQALANDYLAPVIRLGEAIGYENVWLLSETLGLHDLDRDRIQEYLVDGSAPVSMLQIAQAYSAFANTGIQAGIASGKDSTLLPAAIIRIEDPYGRPLFQQETIQLRALLSPGLAYLVHDVISDPIARRPSLGHPNALEIGRPAGAKIGWLSGGKQTWTVGYTPETLAVVWMGMTDADNDASPRPLTPDMPAGIWHALMQYVEPGAEQAWKQPPEIVQRTVCTPSGQLPTASCPSQASELFLAGSEPVAADTLYQAYAINRETGKLATIFTPLEKIEEKTFFIPPPAYQDWALANGYPQPPTDYDLIREQEPLPDVAISSPSPFSYVSGEVSIRGTAGGDEYISYRVQVGQGLNPQSWIQIGEESDRAVMNGRLAVWNTRGLDGLYVIRLTVLRTRSRLESHVVQVSVDNTPPSVSITYPAEGASIVYQAEKEPVFLAEASDTVGIAGITWYLDGKVTGEGSQAPFFLQQEMTPGEHTLQVEAVDLAGNTTRSEVVHFSVTRP